MFHSTKHSNNWKQKQDGQLVIIIIDKATFIVSITFIIFGVAFVVIVFSESSFSDGKWRYFVGLVHAQTCTASSLTSSKDHHFFVFHYHHHKRLVTSHHNHHQKQSLSSSQCLLFQSPWVTFRAAVQSQIPWTASLGFLPSLPGHA